MKRGDQEIVIDAELARRLVSRQFPEWGGLAIRPVKRGGWDNRTFHLGGEMLVRMPSGAAYAAQVEKEQEWLPKLAPFLPRAIPEPLAMGAPGEGYPWKWSIYRWLEGESAAAVKELDLSQFAIDLAQFLIAFEKIDVNGGPLPGAHSFERGGALAVYDRETRYAIQLLREKIDATSVIRVWEEALATCWERPPVWVHGDLSPGNLLVQKGGLSAVIDFGQLTVGDPACDLAIAWTFFKGASRERFRETLRLDDGTWARGRGWALWKALIVAAGLTNVIASEVEQCSRILDELLKV